jgi:hypothetical protein
MEAMAVGTPEAETGVTEVVRAEARQTAAGAMGAVMAEKLRTAVAAVTEIVAGPEIVRRMGAKVALVEAVVLVAPQGAGLTTMDLVAAAEGAAIRAPIMAAD